MYTFQERTENFSGRAAPRSGRAAAQRNETERVLQEHAPEKRHRRDSQRVGVWARDETDKISWFKPRWSIALFHGRSLQRETIPKSTRVPDENTGSESDLRAQGRHFTGYGIVAGEKLPAAELFCYPYRLLASMAD